MPRVLGAAGPASAVCLCAEITVALRASPRIAAGLPTLVERPTTHEVERRRRRVFGSRPASAM